ncbi:MAG: hypothetical protein MJ072_04240, partial [Clostridia bacterium]|nr:hypothetical protein [Clostridia bacterium]
MNDKIKAISTLFLIAVFCVLFAACSPAHNKSAEMSHDAYSHWYTCSECEEKLEKGDHVWVKGRTASCTAKATRKCSVCGYEEEIGKLHNLTFVEAKTATATTHGNIEYYQCEGGCGKKFADANGIIELTDEEVNTYVVSA